MSTETAARPATHRVELGIDGMTCGSCPGRVQRALAGLDGVSATVNLATRTAFVGYPADLDPAELLARVAAAGYSARWPSAAVPDPTDPAPALRARLLVVAPLALPVLVLSAVPAAQFRHWQWLALALAAPVVLWGAWPWHRAAVRLAGRGRASSDTMVSLGTLAGLGWSSYALLLGGAGEPGWVHPFPLTAAPVGGGPAVYLDVAAGVTMLALVGRLLQDRCRRAVPGFGPGAAEVTVLPYGAEARVPVGELAVGDQFVVRPGETITADGVVLAGRSAVDSAALTGAAIPVEVRANDLVRGGCVNVGGRLVVRATAVGPATRLARTAQRVAAAQRGRAEVQRRADRVAGALVPVVLGLAAAALGFGLGAGADPATACGAAVAVLVVAAPCALGLATPLALLAGTARAAQLGVMITGPAVLDAVRRVDTVVLDRTGMVSTGMRTVHRVQPAAGVDPELALRLAGAVEQASTHPIGLAITAAATAAATTELPGVAEFDAIPGRGVRGLIAEVDGDRVIAHAVLVGRPALLAEHDIELPADLIAARAAAEAAGHTAIAVAWDGVARAVLAVGDEVEPACADAMRRLLGLGLTPVLLTGDTAGATRVLAERLGVDPDGVLGEVRPEDKADVVRRLHGEGRVVAVVGDPADDAAALAAADLALVVGPAADAAAEHAAVAGVAVPAGGLPRVVDALRLARRSRAVICANTGWTVAYHAAALPLAATGLINPMIAAGMAALSSAVVLAVGRWPLRFGPAQPADMHVT